MTAFRSSGDLSADRRYLWGEASMAQGDFVAAADLFAQAVELAPGWASGWFALGEARARAGSAEAAGEAFRRCLALEPEDILGAGLRLARIAGAAVAMPAAYVAGLFDDYADRFDAHLTGALGYRGPEVILAALDRLAPGRRYAAALDLGCGTGLMAAALAGRAGAVDGVDLSAAMVREAAARGIYRRLAVADVVAFLADAPDTAYDLALAADVLVYLGDLDPLFAGLTRALTPGGLFAFTVQGLDEPGFGLGDDLRYAHSESYLRQAAERAGLAVRCLEAASTRRDAGRDVPGYVAVLRR